MEGSLFASIEQAGEKPELLAIRMAEIFAWDIDFYTDPRQGDQFCLLVEKKVYVNGQEPTYKRILSAKYVNSGTPFYAYLFPDKDGKDQYYSGDGKSLQSAFLRSPLKFEARVSSRFSHSRFHPVLKIHRPHLGTDYAAPRGSPVQAVASGRISFLRLLGWLRQYGQDQALKRFRDDVHAPLKEVREEGPEGSAGTPHRVGWLNRAFHRTRTWISASARAGST